VEVLVAHKKKKRFEVELADDPKVRDRFRNSRELTKRIRRAQKLDKLKRRPNP